MQKIPNFDGLWDLHIDSGHIMEQSDPSFIIELFFDEIMPL